MEESVDKKFNVGDRVRLARKVTLAMLGCSDPSQIDRFNRCSIDQLDLTAKTIDGSMGTVVTVCSDGFLELSMDGIRFNIDLPSACFEPVQ
jgi:hypothetical protein